jgi:hypothetical protein
MVTVVTLVPMGQTLPMRASLEEVLEYVWKQAVRLKTGEGLPDHELVVTGALVVVGVSSREDVVGDVGADVARLVVPGNAGGHALDVANLEALGELLAGVGVALDIVLAALPVPCSGPADARVRGPVDGRALAARGGVVLAPVVVVELVSVAREVVVLSAELGSLTAHRGHGCSDGAGGGEGQKAGQDGGLEQHIGGCVGCWL